MCQPSSAGWLPYRSLPTTVFAPVQPGPWPLLVFAHGFATNPDAYTPLLTAWAAAGYVVAAPEFPISGSDFPGPARQDDIPEQARDLSAVIDFFVDPTRAGPAGFGGWVDEIKMRVVDYLYGIPYMVIVAIVIVIIGDLALRHTHYFRQVYYIGSNDHAARLSGIPVDRVKISAYMLTATLASLAGVIVSSRLMSGTPTAASGMELQVLAACVIGGASLTGGEGTVLGAFLGVFFVQIISNAMTILRVSIYWQQVVTGTILVIAVAADMLIRRRNTT